MGATDYSEFSVLSVDFTLDGKEHSCLPSNRSFELFDDESNSEIEYEMDTSACDLNGDFDRVRVKRILMVDVNGNTVEMDDFKSYPDLNGDSTFKL